MIQKILQRLLQNNVECVLIGGFAAVAHGCSTLTLDLDVCFSFHPENVKKLLNALGDIHPHVRAGSGVVSLGNYPVERLSQLDNLYIKTDIGDLDLLGFVEGLGKYDEVKNHSIEIEVFKFPCRILDIDSLIKTKQAIGRPKDHQTVLELQAIKEKLGCR